MCVGSSKDSVEVGTALRVDPGARNQRKRKTEKEISWKNEAIIESCRARYPRLSFFFFVLSFELFLCFWLVSVRTDSQRGESQMLRNWTSLP